jgi:ribose/xylose/arabinose/galactoside ABC-type transport system permease subunit
VWAFVIASVTAALAGSASASSLGAATVGSFHELTINAAAAVLIGGIAVQGGFGSPLRAAVGAVIISMLTNVMLLHDLSEGGRQAAVGLAVVFVVLMLRITDRKGRAK